MDWYQLYEQAKAFIAPYTVWAVCGLLALFFLLWLFISLWGRACGTLRMLKRANALLPQAENEAEALEHLQTVLRKTPLLAAQAFFCARAYGHTPAALYFTPARLFPRYKSPVHVFITLPLWAGVLHLCALLLGLPAYPVAWLLLCLFGFLLLAAFAVFGYFGRLRQACAQFAHMLDTLPAPLEVDDLDRLLAAVRELRPDPSFLDEQRKLDMEYIRAFKEISASNMGTQAQLRDTLRSLIAELAVTVKNQRAVNTALEQLVDKSGE